MLTDERVIKITGNVEQVAEHEGTPEEFSVGLPGHSEHETREWQGKDERVHEHAPVDEYAELPGERFVD